MTELMKKRNELNSQRMNGLNDPGEDLSSCFLKFS